MLLLDNHDSFTWNLAELLLSIGSGDVEIISSTEFRPEMMDQFDRIIFSPGPGLPVGQPAMFAILRETELRHERNESCPRIFGVCLGMQAIAVHFGATLINLPSVVHGQPRSLKVFRPDHPLFHGIPDGTPVGLYHSWAVDRKTLPASLETLAISEDGTIMALAHKKLPICGVQFHPESIMTPHGSLMIQNWLTT